MPKPKPDESEEFYDSLKSDQEKLLDLIDKYHQKSEELYEIELELAPTFLKSVEPMRSIYERTHKHTAFRSAICSIFADPEDIDLIKYERDHE